MLKRYQWWSILLLNLNALHTRSNWLWWKAQEKFQVESRFCKTIGCSYVTLLSTYPVKKTVSKVSNRNTRKRYLLTSKITLKTSERRHLTTSNFPRIYTNLQSSLLSVLLSSLMDRNFNNSRPLYVFFWEMRNQYRNIWFMKNSKCQHFLFLKKQPQKWTDFSTFYLVFKGPPF